MRRLLLSAACLALAGCTSVQSTANTAPRGSQAFCEQYGRQTAANRIMDSGNDGSGPNGFDVARARSAGRTAFNRCLSGTNTDAQAISPVF